jgi:hypothetical protein
MNEQQQSKRIILALGLFSPIVDGVGVQRGMGGVIRVARSSFTND